MVVWDVCHSFLETKKNLELKMRSDDRIFLSDFFG